VAGEEVAEIRGNLGDLTQNLLIFRDMLRDFATSAFDTSPGYPKTEDSFSNTI
jgi:hypothetical protein